MLVETQEAWLPAPPPTSPSHAHPCSPGSLTSLRNTRQAAAALDTQGWRCKEDIPKICRWTGSWAGGRGPWAGGNERHGVTVLVPAFCGQQSWETDGASWVRITQRKKGGQR